MGKILEKISKIIVFILIWVAWVIFLSEIYHWLSSKHELLGLMSHCLTVVTGVLLYEVTKISFIKKEKK